MNLKILLVLCALLLSRAADEQPPSPTLDPTIPTVTDEKKTSTDAPVQLPTKAPVLLSTAKPSIGSSEHDSTAKQTKVPSLRPTVKATTSTTRTEPTTATDEKTAIPTKMPDAVSAGTESPVPTAKPTVKASEGTTTQEPTTSAKTTEPTMATTNAAKTSEPTIATTLQSTIAPTAELTTVIPSLAPTVEVTKKATAAPTFAATVPAIPTAAPTEKVTKAAPTASPTVEVTSADTPTTQPMQLPLTPIADTQPTSASQPIAVSQPTSLSQPTTVLQPSAEPTRRGKKRRSQQPVGGGGGISPTLPVATPIAAPLALPVAAPTGQIPAPTNPFVALKPTQSPVADISDGSNASDGSSESSSSIEGQGELLAIAMALLSKLDTQVVLLVVMVVIGVVLFILHRRRSGAGSEEYSVLPTSESSSTRPVKPDSAAEDKGWEVWEEDDADEIVRAQQSHVSLSGHDNKGSSIQMASLGRSSRSSTPSRKEDVTDKGSSILSDVKIKPVLGSISNTLSKPAVTPSSKSSSSSFKTDKSNNSSFVDSSSTPNNRSAGTPYTSRSSRVEVSSASSADIDLFASIGITAAPKFTPPKLSMPLEYKSHGGVKSLKDIEADVSGQWGGDDIDLDD